MAAPCIQTFLGRPRWVGAACAGILAAQQLLVEPLLRAAFSGQSFAWLNELVARSGRPLERWLDRTWWLSVAVSLPLLVAALVLWIERRPRFRARIGMAAPFEIGVMRAGICGVLLAHTAAEAMTSVAALPAELRQPMGLMRVLRWVPGVETVLSSSLGLELLRGGALVALLLSMIGLWTRRSIIVALVLSLVGGGVLREVTHFFHSGLIPLYLLFVLAISDAGAGFSVDYLRKLKRGLRPRFGRAVFRGQARTRWALWVSTALPYVFAGLCKLRESGWRWSSPENLRAITYGGTLNVPDVDFPIEPVLFQLPDLAFRAMGALTLVLEVGSLLLAFSQRARRILPAALLALHLGILVFQGFTFWDALALHGFLFAVALVLPFPRRSRAFRSICQRFARLDGALAGGHRDGVALRPAQLGPAAVAAWLGLQCFVWAGRFDAYPVTQWRMYAELHLGGVTHYWTAETRGAGGDPMTSLFEACPPVYRRDARYRDLLLRAKPGLPNAVVQALEVCRSRYEAELGLAAPAEVRLQLWKWDFATHAAAPSSGSELITEHRIALGRQPESAVEPAPLIEPSPRAHAAGPLPP